MSALVVGTAVWEQGPGSYETVGGSTETVRAEPSVTSNGGGGGASLFKSMPDTEFFALLPQASGGSMGCPKLQLCTRVPGHLCPFPGSSGSTTCTRVSSTEGAAYERTGRIVGGQH